MRAVISALGLWFSALGARHSALGVAQGREPEPVGVGVAVVFVASEPGAVGVLPRFRWRVGREVGLAAGAGAVRLAGGSWAGRGEVAMQFRFGGWSGQEPVWYLTGGVAGVTGPSGGGYLMAGAGVELPAGGSGGWWGELGVAGGVRLAAGYQVAVGRRKR